VVVEKPFGRDLASARELDRRLAAVLGEHQIFRIDHYLAKETVQKLNAALVKALAHPEVRAGIERGAYESVPSSPEELAAITKESYERWGKVIRDIGIKAQ